MGPRRRSRGNGTTRCEAALTTLLQWGRGVEAAEMLVPPSVVNGARYASMGPRRRSRGNLTSAEAAGLKLPLQWGRGVEAAEIC